MKAQLKAALIASGLFLVVGLAGCGGASDEEGVANRTDQTTGGSGSMAPGAERGEQ